MKHKEAFLMNTDDAVYVAEDILRDFFREVKGQDAFVIPVEVSQARILLSKERQQEIYDEVQKEE